MIAFLYSLFISLLPGPAWVVKYTQTSDMNCSALSQYVVIENRVVTQINIEQSDNTMASAFRYDLENNTVSIKVVSHLTRVNFFHEIPYDKHFKTWNSYYITEYLNEDSSLLVLRNNGKTAFTILTEGTLPNLHPLTLGNNNVKSMPAQITNDKGCVLKLKSVSYDRNDIDKVLQYVDTNGYMELNLEDLKDEALFRTGMEFEDLFNTIKRLKAENKDD